MTNMTPSHHDGHVPVLLDEVISMLEPKDGALFVDATFGRGGYSRALLSSADCHVFGIDRDPTAISMAAEIKKIHKSRFDFINGTFGTMQHHLNARGITAVDGGIVLDLGVSSPQIDDASRGFSFNKDGPLDMRMECKGPDATLFVNSASEQEIAHVVRTYGEERRAVSVAKAIVSARKERPILRTLQLASIIRRVVKKSIDGLDPATRTFQAIRVHINNELEELMMGLEAAEAMLTAKGRLVVVSFHSLEDRIVKTFFRERSGGMSNPSRHRPSLSTEDRKSLRLLTKRPIRPGRAELNSNPRARSAQLRVAEKRMMEPGSVPGLV